MTAIAVFTCHSSSHPFQERRIPLKEPVKIGRSVAKARPTVDNGIFDCKVLSRNHALIWYDHNAHKFYLQDTKSSNGTFINNQRLSRGAEESPAHELNSGDVIQFGVDVMENSRRGVVTHGCIVSQLTLFNPDGSEAVRSSPAPALNYNSTSATSNNVPSQDLYQLSHYLKEALHREQMLEQKLAGLQRLLSSTQEASEGSWQALIDEDRLLSRLEVLESQLRAYSKANSEESIRKELVALQEDKHNYESTAKESLKRALEEKLEACRKLSDMERMLSNSEDECAHTKEEVEHLQAEQQALLSKHSEVAAELKEVAQKLTEAEKLHADEVERLTIEKTELERKVDIASREEVALATRIEEMQAECDFSREQLAAVKLRFEEAQEQLNRYAKETEKPDKTEEQEKDENRKIIAKNEEDTRQIITKDDTDSSDAKDNTIDNSSKSLKDEEGGVEKDAKEEAEKEPKGTEDQAKVNGEATPTDVSPTTESEPPSQRSLEEQLERYRAELLDSQTRLQESQDEVSSLQLQLKQAQLEAIENIAKANAIEEKLKEAERNMEEAIAEATSDLRERIAKLEASDSERSIGSQVIEEPIFAKTEEKHLSAASPDAKNNLLNTMLPEQLVGLHNHLGDNTELLSEAADTSLSETLHDDPTAHLNERLEDALQLSAKEIETLKEKLQASLSKQKVYEDQLEKLRRDLTEMQKRHGVLVEEKETLREQLIESQDEAKEATDRAEDLQEQLDRVENSAKEVNDQILELRDQLMEEQQAAKASVTEATQTKQLLSKEQEALKRQGSLLEQIQKQLTAVEEKSLESEASIEDYEDQVKSLKKELEKERQQRQRLEKESTQAQQTLQKRPTQVERVVAQRQGSLKSPPSQAGSKPTPTLASESLTLKTECTQLKAKLAEAEEKLNRMSRQNSKSNQDTNKLQILLRESEAQREKLSDQEFQRKKELKESAKEVERARQQLTKALEENRLMEERVRASEAEKVRLQREVQQGPRLQENGTAAASTMKYVPVIVILIAIVAASVQFLVAMMSTV